MGETGIIDFGNGFAPDFSDFLGQEGDTGLLAETTGDPGNAAVEGEEAERKEVAEPEKPTEPEKAEEPEKPAEPEGPKTFEFKIKYRGEEMVEKLTEEQLIARIQMSKDYTVKSEELARKRQEVEAVEAISKTPWFKGAYEEAIRTGALEVPTEAPESVDPADAYEFEKRKADPDFEDIRGRMREYALTLPEAAQAIIRSNHRVFLKEYDRIAGEIRKPKETTSEAPKLDPAVARKILASKEVAKSQAVVEKPGVGSPEVNPDNDNRKRLAALYKQAKSGDPSAAPRLAYYHMYGKLPDF